MVAAGATDNGSVRPSAPRPLWGVLVSHKTLKATTSVCLDLEFLRSDRLLAFLAMQVYVVTEGMMRYPSFWGEAVGCVSIPAHTGSPLERLQAASWWVVKSPKLRRR